MWFRGVRKVISSIPSRVISNAKNGLNYSISIMGTGLLYETLNRAPVPVLYNGHVSKPDGSVDMIVGYCSRGHLYSPPFIASYALYGLVCAKINNIATRGNV